MKRLFWRFWPHEHQFVDWRHLTLDELHRRYQADDKRWRGMVNAGRMDDCVRCGRER